MPEAFSNLPSLVLVLNTTLSAAMRTVGRLEHHVAAGGQLAGLDVHLEIVGEEFLAGIGAAGFAFDFDLTHQPHPIGVDALERKLFGSPAREGLGGRFDGEQRQASDDESQGERTHHQ